MELNYLSLLGVLERIIAGLTLPMDQVEHLHSRESVINIGLVDCNGQ